MKQILIPFSCLALLGQLGAKVTKPNVILIMADDLGWNEEE